MSIRDQIKMHSLANSECVTFIRDSTRPGDAEAQLESELSPIVTQRALKLVKDGQGEREWTEEEQQCIHRLKAVLRHWSSGSEDYQVVQWALSRLESLSATNDDPIPHSAPTEATTGEPEAFSGNPQPQPPSPYYFRPHRVGVLATVREDDPVMGAKVAFAGAYYEVIVSEDGRIFAVCGFPDDDLLLLPPGSFVVTEWTAYAKEGGR